MWICINHDDYYYLKKVGNVRLEESNDTLSLKTTAPQHQCQEWKAAIDERRMLVPPQKNWPCSWNLSVLYPGIQGHQDHSRDIDIGIKVLWSSEILQLGVEVYQCATTAPCVTTLTGTYGWINHHKQGAVDYYMLIMQKRAKLFITHSINFISMHTHDNYANVT